MRAQCIRGRIGTWLAQPVGLPRGCVAALVLSVGALACTDNTSAAGGPRSADVEPRSVLADSCRSAPRPRDALREITDQLELAVWEDPVCNALNVEVVNWSSTPLKV